MRNKVVLVLAAALLLQCCCLSGLMPQVEDILGEVEQQLTLEMPVDAQPTIAMNTPAPVKPTAEDEPQLNLSVDPVVGSTTYTVQQTLTLTNDGSVVVDEIKLHMAMLKDWAPYQTVTVKQVSPETYETFTDGYDNQYALFWLYDIEPGDSIPINIEYEVTVNALDFDLGTCSGDTIAAYMTEEKYLEVTNAEISTLAEFLTADVPSQCDGARMIYTFVIDAMDYAGYVPGDNGALQAFQTGSGDCTDYADLMIAVSRAAGIPARFVEGITYGVDGYYDEGQTKHDWLEVYLPGSGWVPMDPTWGENDEDTYFAGVSPDHIVLTKGRNLDTLNGYHYWAYWWWGDDDVEVAVYDEAWIISKK